MPSEKKKLAQQASSQVQRMASDRNPYTTMAPLFLPVCSLMEPAHNQSSSRVSFVQNKIAVVSTILLGGPSRVDSLLSAARKPNLA